MAHGRWTAVVAALGAALAVALSSPRLGAQETDAVLDTAAGSR